MWAPNATRVSVVGDFNVWDGRRHPMRLRRECGVGRSSSPASAPANATSSRSPAQTANCCRNAPDPYARAPNCARPRRAWSTRFRLPPAGRRGRRANASTPISIYEVHLGSWRRRDGYHWLGWDELADRWCRMRARWASRTSSCCRSANIPSTARGATSRPACSRRRRASANRGPARFIDRATKRARRDPRLGAGALSERRARPRSVRRHGLYEHADPRRASTATGTR